MSDATSLAGRTVLVTGAPGGLGQEICREFARQGAHVAIHHLGQAEQAAALAVELEAQGAKTVVVEGDVTDWDAAAAFVAATEDALGPIDVLVNNAGYMAAGRILDMTLEEWRRTLSIDLDGVFIVSRHVVGGMIERGNGSVINMSSQLAAKGAEDFSSYCAAKAGVLGLTRAMARELGPTVRVNAVAPGPITTPMTAASFDDELTRQRTAGLVAGRMGQANEVAPAVAFLASDGASFIHGQTLHVNGGGVMA
ncbi:SDR family NAD(P)-dependent oxidoreductase [Nocardioides zeicaulis]|uniref:SDR family NAD(P)-dependent oxidoreductase n=1 Tax=Nocardioides zeicaulis TaxID=1776857 RepID=A0ABV6DWR4_9ACTN